MSGILQTLIYGVSVVKDAYFNLVTLLLNTTSTNGAQNNTFLDSSTNNFTITRNGNTTQGTFTPFSQTGWSNYFTGSAGLTTNSNAGMGVASNGDVTIEVWLNTFTTATNEGLGDSGNSICGTTDEAAWNSTSYGIILNSTGICLYNGNGGGVLWSMSCSINDGKWHHVAVVRSSGTWQTFIDGTSIGTTTTQGTRVLGSDTYKYAVGTVAPGGGSGSFLGYLSNFRFTKSAVYTSNFTPSTTPLTAITNTALLTLQSNRFLDNSSSPKTFTVYGTPSVQAFSPFVPTTAYSTTLVGGSGYFDGSGDYLNLPSSSAALQFGLGDFTIEFWAYPLNLGSNSSNQQIMFVAQGNSSFVCSLWNGNVHTAKADVADLFDFAATEVRNNNWFHVAIARSTAVTKCFVNGVQVGSSQVDANNFNGTGVGSICANYGGGLSFNGYVAGMRVLKGTALYTSNFSIPTTPPTAITNTSLLTNFTNAGIYDSAAKNDLETVGNAQVSTTQAKFGTTSMVFDGSGDFLQALSIPSYNFGTGNFTLECWAWCNNFSSDYRLIAKVANISSYGSWQILVDTSGYPRFYASSAASSWDVCSNLGGGVSISTGTWNHIAVTRSGTTFTIWVNGVSAGSTTNSSSLYYSASVPVTVGGMPDGTRSLDGYIDDARITTGYARYTANFTPPAAAFPIQ